MWNTAEYEVHSHTFWVIEDYIREIQAKKNTQHVMAVIDDCQRIGAIDQPLNARLPIIAEQLEQAASELGIPIFAVWPDLAEDRGLSLQIWAEKVSSAAVIMVLEIDAERSRKLTEPNRAVTLHIVKNRGGEKGKLSFEFFPAFSRFAEACEP